MTCDEALEAISAALDGELSQAERAKLSDHLLECPKCRELAEDLRVLTDTLEDCEQAPPPELAASIRRAVTEEAVQSAPPKKRKAPYLHTVAAMLALCVCLGGIGLFAAGQKGGMSGGAAADNAAPAEWSKSSPEMMADGTAGASEDDALDYGVSDECESNAAPMEPPEMPAGLGEAPVPAPSSAPAPAEGNANNDSDSSLDYDSSPQASVTSGAVGGASPSPSAFEAPEVASITAEEALKLAFEYVGGYEEYPEARWSTNTIYGFDAPTYYLKTVETEAGSNEYCLDYVGLSANERCYLFHLYENVSCYQSENSDYTATINWFAVPLDNSGILQRLPPDDQSELWGEYFDAYDAATIDN